MNEPLVLSLERATHRVLAALEASLGDTGLGAAEANALGCFGAERSCRVGALARATGQRPSTLTGVLDRLAERGLLERRPDDRDRRAVLAVLTRDGEAARDRVLLAMTALERGLAAQDVRALRAVLERFPQARSAG
jgi:DNA-binding MarR family transcriptional regulator